MLTRLILEDRASREAAERVVAPLPPSQVEGESGGREWPAAGQGEAGVTQHGEGAAASARVSGDRGLETLPRGPTARGELHSERYTAESAVSIVRNAPSAPKFNGSRASFHIWVEMFGGFARMHGYYDAFSVRNCCACEGNRER